VETDPRALAYLDASGWFVSLVTQSADHLAERQSSEWTLLDLIAHADRAHLLVGEYLASEAPPLAVGDPYFSPAAVAQRARSSVVALGHDPVKAIVAHAIDVAKLVQETSMDAPLHSPMGTMTLGDFLPSRTAELVLHGLDLAQLLRIDSEPPATALRGALAMVADRTASRGDAVVVLRALTGRGALPEGFSIY